MGTLVEYFGSDEGSKVLAGNGEREDKEEEEWEGKELDKEDFKELKGLVARINFMTLDCPDLQFVIKECSREMSKPTWGS
eukprot:5957868-Karenia_brevis.AAC.1